MSDYAQPSMPSASMPSGSMPSASMPSGFDWLASEPQFDPSAHLALEAPTLVESLSDFGYEPDDIAQCPSDFAVSSVFRVLSDEGAACLLDVCRQLSAFTRSNARIERNTRGGVYRSKFLRDMCLSPDITEFMSQIAKVPLAPHSIAHQLGHLNYNPLQVGKNVDKWHVDTLRYDYVMFVTDPNAFEGGEFQYFKGTKHEMAEFKANGQDVPSDRIVSPNMPGPGYAILQQGNMVVHQAKGLREDGERITMVNGYVAADATIEDFTRYDQLKLVDPADVASTEFARHHARLAERLVSQAGFTSDDERHIANLREAARRLLAAADEIEQTGESTIDHY